MLNRSAPARRCPTTSARLPFLTLVIKAPSRPVSVIFPPTTCKQWKHREWMGTELHVGRLGGNFSQISTWALFHVLESVNLFYLSVFVPHYNIALTLFSHYLFYYLSQVWYRSEWEWILLTFRPRREPASRGMADLLLSVMRPIRWSPSLDGCQVTGCWRGSYDKARRVNKGRENWMRKWGEKG